MAHEDDHELLFGWLGESFRFFIISEIEHKNLGGRTSLITISISFSGRLISLTPVSS